MVSKPENTPIIKTNPLENSVAVQETVIEHGDLRVRFGVKFSVDVNLRVLDTHCGGPWATFDCRFNYCIRSRLMTFRFVYYRSVSGFDNRKKIFDVYSRTSRRTR